MTFLKLKKNKPKKRKPSLLWGGEGRQACTHPVPLQPELPVATPRAESPPIRPNIALIQGEISVKKLTDGE